MVDGSVLLRLLVARSISVARGVAVVIAAVVIVRSTARAESAPQVPEGFVIERVADESAARFPMFGSVDERGRLYIAESSGLDLYQELSAQTRNCRVRLLEDRDGDGHYETESVFADRLVYPMGLAWHDGRLFVADPPDVIVLEDVDGDGRAERRNVILSGFGHQDNGSLHGLRIGPDGLLYMTMGSPDGYRLPAHGGFVSGTSGALIRCRTDGSHVEVICRGFVNLVEIAFLPTGEIVGTDNWFQRPQAGIRDALVHLVAGGLYPYLADEGTPQPLTGIELPAMTRLPAVAVSGLECYRGSAFPPEFHGNLFSAQHNARAVSRHVPVRDGSTFRTDDYPFVTSDDPDFHPSDVLEDFDGSLIVVDTGGWYVQHCPTGSIRDSFSPGGIYRVRHRDAQTDRTAARDARRVESLSSSRLVERLSDPRPYLRELARRQLVVQGPAVVPMLATVLDSLAPFTAKEQALWALAVIEGDAAETALRDALAADATCVVVLAARVCGARRCRSAARGLERLLGHERAQVRQAAAEALAHCGDRSSLPQIFASLASTDEAVTRHSLIYAIHRLAATNDLLQLAQEAEADVRSVSLRLLDQPPRSAVPLAAALAAIGSPDARLREAGIFVVRRHPEWSDVIADTLRQWLASPKLPPELDPAVYELVSELLANRSISGVAAESLAGYQAAGQGERIGRLLQAIERSRLREIPGELVGALKQLIDDRDAAVRSAAMRTIGVLGIVQLDRELSAIAADARQPTPCRLAALHALRGRRADAIQDGWDVLVAGLAADAPAVDRLMAFEVISVGQLTKEQLREFLPLVAGDPLIAPSGLIPLLQRSLVDAPVGDVFDYLDAALRGGWMPSAADVQPLLDKLVTFDADRTAQLQEMIDVATGGQRERLQSLTPLLSSGDVNRGRSVFMTSQAACAKCHRIGREGGSIGPELTRIGAARTARDLLESIVVPAATIAQGYELHQLVTTDGRSLVGAIIGQDDAHLLLRNTSGAEQRIARSDIEQIQRSSGSIMPDGLDRVLTQDELRDVIAYLVSLR